MNLKGTQSGQCFDFILQSGSEKKPNSHAGEDMVRVGHRVLQARASLVEWSGKDLRCVGTERRRTRCHWKIIRLLTFLYLEENKHRRVVWFFKITQKSCRDKPEFVPKHAN